jgi:hypothetical protein
MTNHDASEQSDRREAGDERERTAVWRHSLTAAAICLGAAALIAILGWPG